MKDKKICVIGLGYIGLPTASLLGTKGFKVHGVDVSQEVVNTINSGKIHIVEPDLDVLVRSAVQAGNLEASTQPCEADIFIIAVPTPFKGEFEPDLSFVESATKMIASYVKSGDLVILESTSPVGTTDEIVATILKEFGHKVGTEVLVAHCPERVLPGRILIELVQNDRVVGGIDEKSTEAAVKFYKSFVSGQVLATTSKTAELVKLTENSFRDVNIAFANELSFIADHEGIDVWEVIELANRHPRVEILKPGPGVGGHCIAVDPWFIVSRAKEHAKLIKTARLVNDQKPDWVLGKIRKHIEKFKNPVVGCLGMSFKANVDDLRESPSLDIVKRLIEESNSRVLVAEPNIKKYDGITLVELEALIEQSDIIVVLVDHDQFSHLTAQRLQDKIVIDTRGLIK